MAQLEPTSIPFENYEQLAQYEQRSNQLEPDAEDVTGALLCFDVADNVAYYVVTKHEPLTLQHIDYCYSISDDWIRGINIESVRKALNYKY